MSLRSTIQYYKQAKYLHKTIDETFNDFSAGKIRDSEINTTVNKALNDINRLQRTLNKININDLYDHYDDNIIETIEHNIEFYYEAADYIEKTLLAAKFHEPLLVAVENYIEDLKLYPGEYRKWAKDEYDVAKKFTAMLLHSDNIMRFINHIKRMSLGTMSKREFKKIWDANKGKIIKTPIKEFQSFKEYNENYEA